MKMPLKPSMLRRRRKSPRWIILHHTVEMYKKTGAKIDNSKYQMNDIFNGVPELKQGDVNYNFCIEKIKEDYNVIVTRPFPYLCDFPDIDPNINKRSIHVSFLGDYDIKIPEKRLYEVACYRIINPLLNLFHLTPSRIKLHSEVSSDKELTCPGEFIDRGIIESMVRKFVLR